MEKQRQLPPGNCRLHMDGEELAFPCQKQESKGA